MAKYEVDPDNRFTWRNWPRPSIAPYVNEQLKKIGGFHVSGRPFLRLVWMPDVKRYFGGKMFPYYINTATDAVIKTIHRLSRTVKDDFGNVVMGKNGRPLEEERFAPSIEVVNKVLEEDKIHREGWYYCPYLQEEYICFQRFAVEEFITTDSWEKAGFSSERIWELERYDEFTDPMTGILTQNCDVLGPYPAPGRYESFIVCEDKINDERGFQIATQYKEPGDWLLEEVRKAWREREQFSNTDLNRASFLKERARAIDLSRRKHRDEQREEMLDVIKPFAWMASDKLAKVYQNQAKSGSAPTHNKHGRITERIVIAQS